MLKYLVFMQSEAFFFVLLMFDLLMMFDIFICVVYTCT